MDRVTIFIAVRPSPMNVILFSTDPTSVHQIANDLTALHLSQSVHCWLYVAEKGTFDFSHYRINKLRNLGVENVRTSHYVILDPSVILLSCCF